MLEEPISPFGETKLPSLQEEFHASLSVLPANKKEQTMKDTCGMSLSGEYEKYNRPSLWQKMFLDFFQQMEVANTKKLSFQWKLKTTKHSRCICQLVHSEPNISERGYGLSDIPNWELIPTPREGSWEKYSTRQKRKGHKVALSYLETLLDFLGFKQYPEFTEFLMGYPEGWTDVEMPHLGTPLFRT